jgi:hypothetical protein
MKRKEKVRKKKKKGKGPLKFGYYSGQLRITRAFY